MTDSPEPLSASEVEELREMLAGRNRVFVERVVLAASEHPPVDPPVTRICRIEDEAATPEGPNG